MFVIPKSVKGRSVPSVLFPLSFVALLAGHAGAVGTRHFVIEGQEDFKKGELDGVSVDSSGQVRPGLSLGDVALAGAGSSWDAIEYEGGLLIATGNEGKLFSVKAGKTKELARTKAMAITSLVRAFGDRIIAGTMPGHQLYELKGDELVEFATLEDGVHVWDLAYDESKKALYAATGGDGKLFRITSDGTAQVYFDSDQPHLVSVVAAAGNVYCGSSGKARLYQLTGPGRATVVHDFESTEVRSIALSKDGGVFAIANELKGDLRDTLSKPDEAAGPQRTKATEGSGALYWFSPEGTPEKLFESEDEHLVSLSLDPEGHALVGTGGEGRVYQVGTDHQSLLLGDVEERQITQIISSAASEWLVTSDPVVLHEVRGRGGVDAVWTSETLDAGFRARFGRMSFDATGQVALSTRTGNTSKPDETWSDWSPDRKEQGPIDSPEGRFLQVRARLAGDKDGALRRIEVPFVTDNLRPVLTEVNAKSAASPSSQGKGAQKSGEPLDVEPKPQIKVTFKVDNPDEDELRYYVEYRPVDSAVWLSALEPGEVLTRAELKWDTAALPEGRYRLRVTASDELSNPPERARRHSLESGLVLVDNTPPRIRDLKADGAKISGVAVDGLGPLRRIEVRVAGQPYWIPVEPTDGVFDQAEEAFEVDLSTQVASEPVMTTVRAFDTAGNSAVGYLTLSPMRR